MENTNQIYLIGMMGSGKSSTAKALSLSLGWNFIDIDNELTKSFDMSINDLFLEGENKFRMLEFAELQRHIFKENTVIAVGGVGVAVFVVGGVWFVVCCVLVVVCCSWFVVCRLLFVVCCLLFAVCCLLFVVCWLLWLVYVVC